MNRAELYKILQTISLELSREDDYIRPLPEEPDWDAALDESGIDILSAQDIFARLDQRIPSKRFKVPPSMLGKLHLYPNLGSLCDSLIDSGFEKSDPFEVVYVDDEPENLFVFRRIFEKDFPLKCFDSSVQAFEYIKSSPQVKLVITDEVMPEMNGNLLRDRIAEIKPDLQFILVTGNPENDDGLMYRSLSRNRFFDFMQKPVDFRANREKLLKQFRELAS